MAQQRQARAPACPFAALYRRLQPAHRPTAACASSNGIDVNGQNVVSINGKWSSDYNVEPSRQQISVKEYLNNAQDNLRGYQLPLGAQLEPVNAEQGEWVMQLPALQFLSVDIRCAGDSYRVHLCIMRLL